MSKQKPIDTLKMMLNTLVLVSGATGSVINLIKGNSIPFAVSIVAVLIVVVIILAEVRASRRAAHDASSGAATPAPGAGARPMDFLLNALRAPAVATPIAAPAPAAKQSRPHAAPPACYLNAEGTPVIRVIRSTQARSCDNG
jgi:hypothetical protein